MRRFLSNYFDLLFTFSAVIVDVQTRPTRTSKSRSWYARFPGTNASPALRYWPESYMLYAVSVQRSKSTRSDSDSDLRLWLHVACLCRDFVSLTTSSRHRRPPSSSSQTLSAASSSSIHLAKSTRGSRSELISTTFDLSGFELRASLARSPWASLRARQGYATVTIATFGTYGHSFTLSLQAHREAARSFVSVCS